MIKDIKTYKLQLLYNIKENQLTFMTTLVTSNNLARSSGFLSFPNNPCNKKSERTVQTKKL